MHYSAVVGVAASFAASTGGCAVAVAIVLLATLGRPLALLELLGSASSYRIAFIFWTIVHEVRHSPT